MPTKRPAQHFLTGEEFTAERLLALLRRAEQLRADRAAGRLLTPLAGKTVILLFEKPSLRTHLSFKIAIQELGGQAVESFSFNRKKEEPEDVARVLGGYAHAIMLRTHEHRLLERMAAFSPVPVINGLSDSHHPCQVLADLLTLQQVYGKLQGLTLAYIGDGNNMLNSLLLLAPFLGVHVRYACPEGYEPNAFVVRQAEARAKLGGATISAFNDPLEAAKGARALYTDVWTSMGFEGESADRERHFEGFQVNEALYAAAAPEAIIMHCMPMVRGKEISETMADHPRSMIFPQSENRLHAQKSLLIELLAGA